MKKITFILFLATTILNVVTHAQAIKATYTYDLNGNRTNSYVYYLNTTLKSTKPDTSHQIFNMVPTDTVGLPKFGWESGVTDPSSGFDIKLFPNPTHSMLVLELSGVNENELAASGNSIGIWNLQGVEIIKAHLPKQSNTFNLSDMPNGAYLVRVVFKGQVKEYKIIKQ